MLPKESGEHIIAGLSVSPYVPYSCPAHNYYLKSDFKNISRNIRNIIFLIICHAKTFGSLPCRSRSQHDIAAKSCSAHDSFIWSQVLKLFHRNNNHIEATCRAKILRHYLKGRGHNMTLQLNFVWPITLLRKCCNVLSHHNIFETFSQKWSQYWDDMSHLGRYLVGQGHSMTSQQNRIWPITL